MLDKKKEEEKEEGAGWVPDKKERKKEKKLEKKKKLLRQGAGQKRKKKKKKKKKELLGQGAGEAEGWEWVSCLLVIHCCRHLVKNIITCVCFHWYPPKKFKYGKHRLGESTLT